MQQLFFEEVLIRAIILKAAHRWTVHCPTKRCLGYFVHPIYIYQWGEELSRRPTSDIFMRASLESLKVAETDREFNSQWFLDEGSRSFQVAVHKGSVSKATGLVGLDSFQFVEDVDTNPERSWQEFKLVSESSPVAYDTAQQSVLVYFENSFEFLSVS